jgi:hypothetical protein
MSLLAVVGRAIDFGVGDGRNEKFLSFPAQARPHLIRNSTIASGMDGRIFSAKLALPPGNGRYHTQDPP